MREPVTILTEADLRKLVPLDIEAIACVEDAFRALATKPVVMPPILRLDIPEHRGEVDVKTAYVPGIDSFAGHAFPTRTFRLRPHQKCGDHDAGSYLARVNGLKLQFARLATGGTLHRLVKQR